MKSILLALLFFLSFSVKAQKPLFESKVDSINAIIKANPLFYYMPKGQYDAFVKKISVTEAGVVSFTDSFHQEFEIKGKDKVKLISDCCPPKSTRTLDILAIQNWDIQFPNAYLMNKEGGTIGRIFGLKKIDLYKLKAHFDVLQSYCLAYVERRENARAEIVKIINSTGCPEPDLKRNAAVEAAMKTFELKKN